jgi:hypothetical protein
MPHVNSIAQLGLFILLIGKLLITDFSVEIAALLKGTLAD